MPSDRRSRHAFSYPIPFVRLERERIGSALLGVPWALRGTPRVVLDPPRGTPGAFLAAMSLIFVSATFTWSKNNGQFVCNCTMYLHCTWYYYIHTSTYNIAPAAPRRRRRRFAPRLSTLIIYIKIIFKFYQAIMV